MLRTASPPLNIRSWRAFPSVAQAAPQLSNVHGDRRRHLVVWSVVASGADGERGGSLPGWGRKSWNAFNLEEEKERGAGEVGSLALLLQSVPSSSSF